MKTLLIVDDEPALRLLLKQFFQKEYEVVVLTNGKMCIDFLNSNALPTALITDWNMPDMTGLDAIKHIRKNERWDALAIIVLSGRENSTDRITCLNAGADDYLVKPFNPEELKARLNAVLRRIKPSV